MLGEEIFDRFLQDAPVCVMVRAALEHVFTAEAVDVLFRTHSRQQYERELLFSSVVDVMSLVVVGVQPSVHAAYRRRREEIGVSVKSLYNKLNGIEPGVSRALVRHTAEAAQSLIRGWQPRPPFQTPPNRPSLPRSRQGGPSPARPDSPRALGWAPGLSGREEVHGSLLAVHGSGEHQLRRSSAALG